MSTPRVLIVGGGLTACTLAHRHAREGVASTILERLEVPGGLIRSEHMNGVLYEPHGSHIFHTEDEEVWALANEMTPFNDYRHRVDIVIEGRILNWPILVSDIDAQSRSDEIHAELAEREGIDAAARAQAANFEEWCLELMGPILYERDIRPYTEKQWGRPARELSAQWAPRRVSVRRDNDPYLFPDPFQGWPAGAKRLHRPHPGAARRRADRAAHGRRRDPRGPRRAHAGHAGRRRRPHLPAGRVLRRALRPAGVARHRVRNVHVPHVEYAQGAMVVNYPGLEYPFVRIHETKQASRQRCQGTVLGFEFTGAPSRYYPIELPHNRQLNTRYQNHVRDRIGAERTFFAGRLVNYVYIDMDDCMRQALDAAEDVLEACRAVART
jgi:UDP-galactopyranose mutase